LTIGEGKDALRAVVVSPLQFGAEPRGVLVMFFQDACSLTPDDQELLQHFGAYAGVTIVMAGMAREQQRRRHEETERIRHVIIQSVLHTVGNEAGLAKLAADSLAEKLAKLEEAGAGVSEDLEQIRSSADRLGQIMGELIRLNESVSEPAQLNLTEAVRVVTRTVERDHFDRILLTHRIAPTLQIEASDYLLREALGNLISNAVQAMIEADGGGALRVSADSVVRDWNGTRKTIVRLDVEDSGPGVLPDFRDRVWEFGFSTRGEGHGHGLYHTRGLVGMLGGAVELVEEPSDLGGAHFRMFLPAGPAH
jgi:signal transduction histidine kinase